MHVTIRPYQETDFDAVTSIWFDGWVSTVIVVARPVTLEQLRERLPQEIERGWFVYVALAPEIVGFLALYGDELEQLFVSPARQRKGIGKHLLDYAKSQKPAGFALITAIKNDLACQFYEREGLKRGKTFVHPRLGHDVVRYDWLP